MRVLIFSWRDIKHPNAGGAEQVMYEHAKGWIKAGHNVTHFSSKMDGLLDFEIIDEVKFIRSGYQYLGVQIAAFFYYIKNRSSIDFVVDEFHGIPFFTPLYIRKPRLAVIQEIARKVWFLNPLPWPLNWIIGTIGFLGEPSIFLFYRSTPFMTGSESAKKDVTSFGIPEEQITSIPHGVIIEKSRLPSGKGKVRSDKGKVKTIVYLGILSKDKGIEDALRSFAILQRKGKFQFWVIGKSETSEYERKLKNLVNKLKLTGKIKFWGYVSQNKKFELLSKAHILINPSIHEGWGLVNIEANTMGTPVVAYNSSGLVDSVKNGTSGILCKENSPNELAQQVMILFGDESKYMRLQKGALSWSKHFSWGKSRRLSLNLIERIASEY